MPPPEINVGVLIAHSPLRDPEELRAFAGRITEDARRELESATRTPWVFDVVEPTRVGNDDPRRPSDFLDDASLRMVEGPYDAVIVVTDVGLYTRRHAVVAGLASDVARVAVLSTRKLLLTPRGKPKRDLGDESVRVNGAGLFLHLLGHLMGAGHTPDAGDVMAPFTFHEGLDRVPRYGARTRRLIEARAPGVPERELATTNALRTLLFHVASAGHNLRQTLTPLLHNRAPLLPLSLPGLATAAVVPTFILVFTAEIWDVGLNIQPREAWAFAVASVVAATWYLTRVQNLFYPRKEKRVVTEHIAVVNVSIFLTMLLAVLGLFTMVILLMLAIVLFVFPPGLIATWPTLLDPVVTFWDKLILASFIASIGVLTGALAGGLESRTLIRHLALFRDEP